MCILIFQFKGLMIEPSNCQVIVTLNNFRILCLLKDQGWRGVVDNLSNWESDVIISFSVCSPAKTGPQGTDGSLSQFLLHEQTYNKSFPPSMDRILPHPGLQ